jgi:hypothetical protein
MVNPFEAIGLDRVDYIVDASARGGRIDIRTGRRPMTSVARRRRGGSLAPETSSKLAQEERTKIIIAPFVGFIDLGEAKPNKTPADSAPSTHGYGLTPWHLDAKGEYGPKHCPDKKQWC